jgi:hypothetical protein
VSPTVPIHWRALIFALASCSINSLLLYFFGVSSFVILATVLLSVETFGLLALWKVRPACRPLIVAGLWAGLLATFAYDVVRVPIVQSGIPVFKAISYFGTTLLGTERPNLNSEVLGWAYHLSNGVSFALMYTALVAKPGPVTAVMWGLLLEGVMLLTPYAEVFGYQRDARFLTITIGSHAVYGLVLWLGLKYWPLVSKKQFVFAVAALGVPLALAGMSWDFSRRYAQKIPASPPPYVGPRLYTSWSVPEPDRVIAIWLMCRIAEPDARFHFVEPFEKIRFGKPFDIPEAEIRRHGMQSATQYLLDSRKLPKDDRLAKLERLARMTNFTEVSPWMLASDAEAGRMAESVRKIAGVHCGRSLSAHCLPNLVAALDKWYEGGLQ